MVVAKSNSDAKHIKHLSTQAKDDLVYFVHSEIGYNYRMTNLQAALGIAQFEQLEKFIEIKNNNYKKYVDARLNLLAFDDLIRSNKWFYSLMCQNAKERDCLIEFMAKNKIQTRPVWKLIHTLKPYENCQAYNIEKAIYYYDRIVNIPCSTNLTENDINRVIEVIRSSKLCGI